MNARLEHGPRPYGADNTTMLLWAAMSEAGNAGITRDELIAVVGPRINVGHARRRYLTARLRSYERYSASDEGGSTSGIRPTFETTDPERAKHHFVTAVLAEMRRWGTACRDEQGRYHAGRRPRAARYQEDEAVLDPSGVRTRLHMTTNEALRVLKPFIERRRASSRAGLTKREFRAIERLVEIAEEELRAGFPTWLPAQRNGG